MRSEIIKILNKKPLKKHIAMASYLYGAAVQGIQEFIFRTNDLRDIIAASDKVKVICADIFNDLLKQKDLSIENSDEAVINAAGNIKYIFTKKEDCEFVVRNFPRIVVEYAPGITVSQAVVVYDETDKDWRKTINDLEGRLHSQRNKPMASMTVGMMGIDRTNGTNLPNWVTADSNNNKVYSSLCEDAFGRQDGKVWRTIFDSGKLNEKNDWIAVIHADGNGLGRVVQKIGGDRDKFKEFSQQLDKDTKAAAQNAYALIKNDYPNEDWKKIPIRPIVLGGDDFSVICRADIALPYVKYFIEEFERLSKKNKNVEGGLTACAGIAFVKSSFPFYYAYELAESLCAVAKKDTKERYGENVAPSCVMFHKVQDSFVTTFKDIESRELHPNQNVTFKFGPYYTEKQNGRWSIGDLLSKVEILENSGKEGNAIKSRLRNWMTLLHDNPELAKQDLERIKTICKDDKLKQLVTDVTRIDDVRIPVYDILAIHTLRNQVTK